MQYAEEKNSRRDLAIIVGTIVVVLLAGFVIYKFATSDQPHPVNEAPTHPVLSEKMQEMQRKKPATAEQASDTERAQHPSGDDVEPPAKK